MSPSASWRRPQYLGVEAGTTALFHVGAHFGVGSVADATAKCELGARGVGCWVLGRSMALVGRASS